MRLDIFRDGKWMIVLPVVVSLLVIAAAVALAETYSIDFDNILPSNYTLLGNGNITDVDGDGDNELFLIQGSSTYVMGGIGIPVNFSWINDTIEFTLVVPNDGDGYFIHLIDSFNETWYPGTIDESYKYEQGVPSGVNYGIVIGIDKYTGTLYIKEYSNGTYTDYSVTYSWIGGSIIPLKIEIVDNVLTVYVNGSEVRSFNVTIPGVSYLVIGGLTRGIGTGIDLWIDDLLIVDDTPEQTSTETSTSNATTTTTTTSTTTTTTTTNTTTTTTTPLTEKIRNWWEGLSLYQKIAVAAGGLILLLILAAALNPSRKVR